MRRKWISDAKVRRMHKKYRRCGSVLVLLEFNEGAAILKLLETV